MYRLKGSDALVSDIVEKDAVPTNAFSRYK
jgi:hypothetical protein